MGREKAPGVQQQAALQHYYVHASELGGKSRIAKTSQDGGSGGKVAPAK